MKVYLLYTDENRALTVQVSKTLKKKINDKLTFVLSTSRSLYNLNLVVIAGRISCMKFSYACTCTFNWMP